MPRKRRRPRRGRFAGLYKLLSVLLIAATVTTACIIFFRIHTISVTGNARYTAEEIIAAAGVRVGGNLITVGRAQTASRLMRGLPYIDTVSVSRRLPDTLVIAVTECQPAFRIAADDGGWWVLDAGGKLLEHAPTPGGYALITGVRPLVPAPGTRLSVHEDETAKLQGLLELMSALRAERMTEAVQSIDLSSAYQITMVYDTRFTVQLPFVTDFAYRMNWLRTAILHESVQEDVAYSVDMTADGETRFIPN